MIVVGREHPTEPAGEIAVPRGDNDAGMAAHRELARNARSRDCGDIDGKPGAALDFRLDMIGQCRDRVIDGMEAFGDHQQWNGPAQRFAQAIDRPGDACRAHPQNDEVGVTANRSAEIPIVKRLDRRQRYLEPRVPAGAFHAVDDFTIEMGSDQPDPMTAIARRQRHCRPHDAGAEDRDDRHWPQPPCAKALPVSASKRWTRDSRGSSPTWAPAPATSRSSVIAQTSSSPSMANTWISGPVGSSTLTVPAMPLSAP